MGKYQYDSMRCGDSTIDVQRSGGIPGTPSLNPPLALKWFEQAEATSTLTNTARWAQLECSLMSRLI